MTPSRESLTLKPTHERPGGVGHDQVRRLLRRGGIGHPHVEADTGGGVDDGEHAVLDAHRRTPCLQAPGDGRQVGLVLAPDGHRVEPAEGTFDEAHRRRSR